MYIVWTLGALTKLLLLVTATNGLQDCSPKSFPQPVVFGGRILNIGANEVYNFTRYTLSPGTSSVSSPRISFCNVSVTYTHPGWNDEIHVTVWLPLNDWNDRLQALGGGGYSATFGPLYLTQAVAASYVATGTDAGLGGDIDIAQDPSSWALTSSGNVNLYLLENYGSRALEDMTIIGKSITRAYYGIGPKYSYFSGCSGGGRQGLALAQKYPDSYDGILAAAPALSLQTFIPAGYWATRVMKEIGYYPPPCEIEAFTQAAVAACDGLDGLEDGIISSPELCDFLAQDVIGKPFICNNSTLAFTEAGAAIVQAAWDGPRSANGRVGWYGIGKDASLTTGYIATNCRAGSAYNCSDASSGLFISWFRYFLAKDPAWNAASMSLQSFFDYLQYSDRTYNSVLGTTESDLASFKTAGGKLITWHGGADEVIPPAGTKNYYRQVLAADPDATGFYRHFEAPGVGHCIGGAGPIPNTAFEALVRWVEDGIAPQTLVAESQSGDRRTRPLCPYPLKQTYVDGNTTNAFFECVASAEKIDVNLRRQSPGFEYHTYKTKQRMLATNPNV